MLLIEKAFGGRGGGGVLLTFCVYPVFFWQAG